MDIVAELNRAGHRNAWDNELSQQNVSMMLKRAEEDAKVKQRKVVIIPAAPADKEAARAMLAKNPTEGKALLAQQILATKDIELPKRFAMTIEVLVS
jgi:hypothetical protein